VPERDRACIFYKADEALFALPPAYFYWQALFFLALPPGYGTARLASAVIGLAAVWLTYELGRGILKDERAAVCGAVLFSLSRVFYFPATTARPDMFCGAVGLAALVCVCQWAARRKARWLIAAGGLLGLGALSHPFAIVYGLQAALWVLWLSRPWTRAILNAGWLTCAALTVFALWLPLILAHPDAFAVQFTTNVWSRSGPGLLARLAFPWPAARHHAQLLLEHAGPWQSGMMVAGLAAVTRAWLRHGDRRAGALAALSLSSVYLLVACQGTHPAKGYWCYPGALLFLCAGWLVASLWQWTARRSHRLAAGVVFAALALMLPGCGVRTTIAHLRHWNDVNYDSPRFIRGVLAGRPRDMRLIVDPAYVFDVWLAGYDVVLGEALPIYFRIDEQPWDGLIVSPYGLVNGLPQRLGGRRVGAYGDRNDPFACYAEVYESGEDG
jgi:4-amino-4-deoxy-L-arabinose transferase-like glycosyltransferase